MTAVPIGPADWSGNYDDIRPTKEASIRRLSQHRLGALKTEKVARGHLPERGKLVGVIREDA